MSCPTCKCPADFEWLPCTHICRQAERQWRLRPARQEYAPPPYAELPDSEDERVPDFIPLPESISSPEEVDQVEEHEQRESAEIEYLVTEIMEPVWEAEDQEPLCSSQSDQPQYMLIVPNGTPSTTFAEEWFALYASQIGYLKEFDHIKQEAHMIFGILSHQWSMSLDEIIYEIELKRPRSPLFARSLQKSVPWHLKMMQEAGFLLKY